MADFSNIYNEIDANINANGQQRITGPILNETLKDMLDEVDSKKQDTLQAGSGISISGNVISATGGGSGTTYQEGRGIDISGNVISADFNEVQEKLIPYGNNQNLRTVNGEPLLGTGDIQVQGGIIYQAGDGIDISNDTISVDANDLAGTGLFADADGNLSVNPSGLAGWGLIDAGGGQLAVDSGILPSGGQEYYGGNAITIEAGNYISVDPSSLAGYGLEDDGSGHLAFDAGILSSYIPAAPTSGVATDVNPSTGEVDVNVGLGLQVDGNNNLQVDTSVVQEKLVAGANITISGNTISATGGGGGGTSYQAGSGIDISNDVISTKTALTGGIDTNSSGELIVNHDNTFTLDYRGALTVNTNYIQRKLTAGNNIQINDGGLGMPCTISATDTDTTYSAGSGLNLNGTTFSVDTSAIQEKLTAGTGISINGNTISATGGGGGGTTYSAGHGIDIDANNEISVDASDLAGTGLTTNLLGKLNVDANQLAGSGLQVDANGYLEVIGGGGGSGLWTNGTGTGSLLSKTAHDSLGTASGDYSISAGWLTSASGDYSVALGENTTSAGDNSFAVGEQASSGGHASVALGYLANSSGDYSFAQGNSAAASGTRAIAMGTNSAASNYDSIALGNGASSSAMNSVAIGNGTSATNQNEVAIGKWNKTYSGSTSDTNTKFTLGNGTDTGNRSNYLEIKENGDAYLVGVGGFTGANSGSSTTLQDAINNGGGSGTTYTAGSGIDITNNTISADNTYFDGKYLPLEGGALRNSSNPTQLDIQSTTNAANTHVLISANSTGQQESYVKISAFNQSKFQTLHTTFYNDRLQDTNGHKIYYPTVSSNDTLAVISDLAGKQDVLTAGSGISISGNVISATGGGSGNYLPLTGGTLQDTSGVSTDLLVESPGQYATVAIETTDLGSGTPESLAKISLSDYDSNSNSRNLILDTTGVSNGSYKISFPTLSGDDTFALLSDIQGGGGSSYTAGSGISITNNVISNTAPDLGIWLAGTSTGSVRAANTMPSGGADSLSFGSMAKAYGANSIALGNQSTATMGAADSIALGSFAYTAGSYSAALGYSSRTSNDYEVALGKHNNTINTGTTAEKTQFTIGNGTNYNARSNIFEIKQNNDAYLVGIGGFDGTNASSAQTLQTVINSKQNQLVSGVDVKTINGQSIVGGGNLVISGGSGGGLWTSGTGTDSLVAPGTVSSSLSQDPASGEGAISCGYDTNASGDYSFAQGGQSEATGIYSFAAVNGAAIGEYSAAIGSCGALAPFSIALGTGQTNYDDSDPDNPTDASYSIAIDGTTYGMHSIALGMGEARGGNSVSIGLATASGENSVSIGDGGNAANTGAVAVGGNALGYYSTATTGSTSNGNYSFAAATGVANGHYSTALSGAITTGEGSFASGFSSNTYPYCSAALGYEVSTYDQADGTAFDDNTGEVALGRMNYTDAGFVFTVGCGGYVEHDPGDEDFFPNPDDPENPGAWTENIYQNAITITSDGSIYIKGLGQYDGTQISGATSLQDLLSNL